MKPEKQPLGLYLHIPFCLQKCKYCDFYSFRQDDADFVSHYVSAMMLQMEDASDACRAHTVDTVYFGGGTPSLLPTRQLERLMDSIHRNFDVAKDAEVTLEINPATANARSLRAMRRLGVNRISLGLQSADDHELSLLGRVHNAADFGVLYEQARLAGFDNISVDIMYGIPDQTRDSLQRTLSYVVSLAPEHLSLYNLKIEDGTPFGQMRDTLALPDEDTEYAMYEDSVTYLAAHGYPRYEMSNFARPGCESRHNLKYWNCDEYLGIGAAAHSYFLGERYATVRDARRFVDGLEILEAKISITEESHLIDKAESMNEYVMLQMRLEAGVDTERFRRRFGVEFYPRFGRYFDEYVPDGFVIREGNTYRFSTKGMFVSNYILSAVLDFAPQTYAGV